MLAQNFKTAAELDLSETTRDILISVLGRFERGEIPRDMFTMKSVGQPACGTPGCILGWARDADGRFAMETQAMLRLCYPQHDLCRSAYGASREQAAHAIRNLLVTGEPRWGEVMAAE